MLDSIGLQDSRRIERVFKCTFFKDKAISDDDVVIFLWGRITLEWWGFRVLGGDGKGIREGGKGGGETENGKKGRRGRGGAAVGREEGGGSGEGLD